MKDNFITNIVVKYYRKKSGLFTIIFLLILSFLIPNQHAVSQQLVCPQRAIEQITDDSSGSAGNASINTDGTRIAFNYLGNLTGDNPDTNFEVYLADTTIGIITQITNETAGTSQEISINSDATRIAFESTANINGGNPDGNLDLYLFDSITGITTQITNEMAVGNFFPSINADGTRIAFNSLGNFTGDNIDGNREIFLYNTSTGIFTQITDTIGGGNLSPSINADGTIISFFSNHNFTGDNTDFNGEIFLFDTSTGMFTQITDTIGGSNFSPSTNANGTRIAFASDANINGGNPDGNTEIYLADIISGKITQITDTMGPLGSGGPSTNANGTRIAFASDANINGRNPDGNTELYVADTISGKITQITDEADRGFIPINSFSPTINADGTRIAFTSNANINGRNPDENFEIYLAVCFDPTTARNIPTLSEWGLMALAGVLGIIGLLALRRRNQTA